LMDGINIRHQRKKLCGTQHTDEHSPAPTAFVMARDCCIRSSRDFLDAGASTKHFYL
jgi:hypothetical protein